MKTNAFVYKFTDVGEAYGNAIARIGAVNHANHAAADPKETRMVHVGFALESIHWNPYVMFDVVIAARQVSSQHVKDLAAARVKEIEASLGPVSKKDRKKIETEVRLEYIPTAPIARKRVGVFFLNGYVYIQTSSAGVADIVLAWLRTILNGLPVLPLEVAFKDLIPLSQWLRTAIHERNAGTFFELGSAGTFTDGVSTIRVKNEDLHDVDLWNVLAGKEVKELTLTTRESEFIASAEFTITPSWQIKNVQNMFEIEGEEWDQAVEQYGDHLAGKLLAASMLDEIRLALVSAVQSFDAFFKGLAREGEEA